MRTSRKGSRQGPVLLAALALAAVVAPGALLPARAIAARPSSPAWQLDFFDEFSTSNDLAGWHGDPGDGAYWIDASGGYLHLESGWGQSYPLVWRNDLFTKIIAENLDVAVEFRFRRILLTSYGSAIGVGTGAVSGTRYPAGDPYPLNHYEDALTNEQHEPLDGFGGHERVCSHRPGLPLPADYEWHVGRAEFVGGTCSHYFDGGLVGTVFCHPRASSVFFGNAYSQSYPGVWTSLDLDYVRIYESAGIPNSSVYLPFILR